MEDNNFRGNSDQIILIDKPVGISSFGVVAKVRWKLTEEKWCEMQKIQPNISRKQARVKVGHCGTLDPFATGLLILVSGKFTRRAGDFAKLDKVYLADIQLGATSTTGDPEGEIRENSVQKIPSQNDIVKLIREKFTGEITQTPPIYSAIKIDGERAYKLARKVKKSSDESSREDLAAKIPPRKVIIYAIEILSYDWPLLTIRAHVSSGTYIRSLAADIGRELGTGAYCAELRREKIGKYNVKNAARLPDCNY